MPDHAAREYSVLRDTIRSRSSLRPIVVLAGVSTWAAALIAVLAWLPNPIASAVPLVVLLTTLEVVRTLHLGVERIGRYLQVFFEEDADGHVSTEGPGWEHTAMHLGPSLPGAGGHPYFLAVFLIATVVNFLAVLFPGPLPIEMATLSVPHLAFIVWLIHCDRGMRRQRAGELSRFRELRTRRAAHRAGASMP